MTAARAVFTYLRPLTGIPMGDAPQLLATSYTITADVEIPPGGAEGMLVTQGGRFGGWGLYVLQGNPVPFKFTGKLVKLTLKIEPRQLTSEEEKRLMQESRRSNKASE